MPGSSHPFFSPPALLLLLFRVIMQSLPSGLPWACLPSSPTILIPATVSAEVLSFQNVSSRHLHVLGLLANIILPAAASPRALLQTAFVFSHMQISISLIRTLMATSWAIPRSISTLVPDDWHEPSAASLQGHHFCHLYFYVLLQCFDGSSHLYLVPLMGLATKNLGGKSAVKPDQKDYCRRWGPHPGKWWMARRSS